MGLQIAMNFVGNVICYGYQEPRCSVTGANIE
jgi:hypothetical protein